MLTKSEQKRIFAEACNGFGFEETEQEADGLYCTGCMVVHKRPIKMYRMGGNARDRECLCRCQVIRLYNPEDQ